MCALRSVLVHVKWRELVPELVEEAGTQAALARQANVSQNTVQRWLKGETKNPDVTQLRAIAAHSRYPLPYLISVANEIPIAEMAYGSGIDLLPYDEALGANERTIVADLYARLCEVTMRMRMVEQSPLNTEARNEETVDGILRLWAQLAGSDDPAVVLRWIAERSWEYRQDNPASRDWMRRNAGEP